MTLEEARTGLSDLLMRLGNVQSEFDRAKYPAAFAGRYNEAKGFLEMLFDECDRQDDKTAFINAVADAPACAAAEQMSKCKKHRQNEFQMQYNLAMVTFVNPVILQYPSEYAEPLVNSMIEYWDEKFPKMQIKCADYQTIATGFKRKYCYITTAVCNSRNLPDDCYELSVLRDYRDYYLSADAEGERLIDDYYEIAPTIVNRINMDPQSRYIYDALYKDYICPCIGLIEQGENEKCKDIYINMVNTLKDKYLYS